MTRALLYLQALAILGAGCSAPSAFEGEDYTRIREKLPLPFTATVRKVVFIDAQAGAPGLTSQQAQSSEAGTPAGSSSALDLKAHKIAQESSEPEILQAALEALKKYDVFSKATKEESWVMQPVEQPLDLEIVLKIKSPRSKTIGSTNFTSMIWANLGLWLFCGVPSWFLADVQIDQRVIMEYTILSNRVTTTGEDRKSHPLEIATDSVDLTSENVLNFVRRASLWQYFAEILVPPFLLPPDREIADGSLYENYLSKLQRDLAGSIKEKLYGWLISARLPAVIVIKPQNGRESEAPEEFLGVAFTHGDLTEAAMGHFTKEGNKKETMKLRFDPVGVEDARARWKGEFDKYLADEAQFLGSYKNVWELRADLTGINVESGDMLFVAFNYNDETKGREVTWSQTIRLTPGPDQ